MAWCDEGKWGPTGSPDLDFPQDSQAGYLFNPKCREQDNLKGRDSAIVHEAISKANRWLDISKTNVTAAEVALLSCSPGRLP